MPIPRPATPDPLRPDLGSLEAAWAARVAADREQVERAREVDDPADYYAPTAGRFRPAPDRPVDPVAGILAAIAHPDDTWLDIGAGGGRYAVPLGRITRGVVAVEPSPAMRAVLQDEIARSDGSRVRVVAESWPPPGWPDPAAVAPYAASVGLFAHVGYDIAAIGPFLDALEAAVTRRCVAVVAEGAMTTIARLLWEPIHGEPRILLPALPELLAVLIARGRLPELRLVPRVVPVYASADELHEVARRQLWLRPGSALDRRLATLLPAVATRTDEGWTVDPEPTRIGVLSWAPEVDR